MSAEPTNHRRFSLGRTVITRGALESLDDADVRLGLSRHARGDWGELCVEDKKANDDALLGGARLLSAYHSDTGQKFWVITESDRSVTTVLLPEEY